MQVNNEREAIHRDGYTLDPGEYLDFPQNLQANAVLAGRGVFRGGRGQFAPRIMDFHTFRIESQGLSRVAQAF